MKRLLFQRLVWAALWLTPMIGRAERYLSAAEAQKVCFPKADKFEGQKLKLTVEQRKAIEQKAGVKVRNPEIRYSVAGDGTNILGVLMFDQVLGKHELIDYAAAISPEGKVLQVELLEYRENYGGEIHNAKWRDQFKGKTTRSSLKLNDDIYNISGATLSCRNVTDGVRRLLATFELVVRPHLLAAAQLPGAAGKP
ncbi:MAG: FMN-binding protein [Verrucomicrobia bacterium]|nr:MAG: FMN-binding protein [Verrucomicrobiota bacterium]